MEIFVEGVERRKGKEKGRKEEKKKGENKEKRKEKKRKRERGRRPAASSSVQLRFDGRNSLNQGAKSGDSTRGYASRGRDSSYFDLLLAFELLFWSAFGTTLCHVYGMFCGINWNMTHFDLSIETGL